MRILFVMIAAGISVMSLGPVVAGLPENSPKFEDVITANGVIKVSVWGQVESVRDTSSGTVVSFSSTAQGIGTSRRPAKCTVQVIERATPAGGEDYLMNFWNTRDLEALTLQGMKRHETFSDDTSYGFKRKTNVLFDNQVPRLVLRTMSLEHYSLFSRGYTYLVVSRCTVEGYARFGGTGMVRLQHMKAN